MSDFYSSLSKEKSVHLLWSVHKQLFQSVSLSAWLPALSIINLDLFNIWAQQYKEENEGEIWSS